MRFGHSILIVGIPSSICLGLLFWALYFFHYFRTRNKIAPLKWSLYIAYALMSYLIITTSVSISQQRFYNRPGSQLDAIVCFFLPIYTTALMVAAYAIGWLFELLVRARKEEYRRDDIQRIKLIYSHLCKYKIVYIILFGLMFVHFSVLAAAKFLPEMGVFPISDIHYAAELGRIKSVDRILKTGIDINTRSDDYENTPLHTSAFHGQVAMIKHLVTKGADINAKNASEQTPLHMAARSDEATAIATLIKLGAYINAQDDNGKTPLHHAAYRGNIDAVKTLVSYGIDVNLKSIADQTAIFYAVSYSHCNIVEILLKNGAEINLIDINSRSPLSVAVSNKYKDIERLLREHGAKE
jgi:ankyrin repeat protein